MRDCRSTRRGDVIVGWLATTLLIAGLCVASGRALAEADGPDYYRVVDVAPNDVLNIRAEPDPHSAKLGEIPPGADCVRNLGCRGGLTFEEFTSLTKEQQAARLKEKPRWCRVEYKGQLGWVAGRFLAEGGCESH